MRSIGVQMRCFRCAELFVTMSYAACAGKNVHEKNVYMK